MSPQGTYTPRVQQVLTSIILSFLDSSAKILLSKDEKWLIRDVHSRSIRMYMQHRKYARYRQDLVNDGILKVYHQYLKGAFTKTYWINVEKCVEIFSGDLPKIASKLEDIRIRKNRGPAHNRVDTRIGFDFFKARGILQRDYREKYRSRTASIFKQGDSYQHMYDGKLGKVNVWDCKWDSCSRCFLPVNKVRQYMDAGQAFVYSSSAGVTLHVFNRGDGIETLVEKKHRQARRTDMLNILKLLLGINHLVTSPENGREYSILSLCRKAIRGCISLNGYETMSLDIKKSQPRLLIKALEEEWEERKDTKGFLNVAQDMEEEIRDFKLFLTKEAFYEDFARMLGFKTTGKSKGELKKAVFTMLFSDITNIGDLMNRFTNDFPLLGVLLHDMKYKLSPRLFALNLQITESRAMAKVVQRMNAAGIGTIRIHDEVIIEKRKYKKAWKIWCQVMDEEFNDKIY